MKLKDLIIIALVVVIIFLFTCNKSKTEYITTEVIRVDSLRVIDTVERILSVPIASVPIHDTIYLNDTLKRYHYGKSDSLLTYNIYVDSECKPEKVGFEYDIKNFTIIDSVYIRDSVHTLQMPKSYVSLGVTMLGNKDNFGFVPSAFYNHKSGNNFGVGYDVMNGNIHLAYLKKLSFRKK